LPRAVEEFFKRPGAIVAVFLKRPPKSAYEKCPVCRREISGSVLFTRPVALQDGSVSVEVGPNLHFVRKPKANPTAK
jgi:hypothetical protein